MNTSQPVSAEPVGEADFMRRVLTVFAFDNTESLWWRIDDGQVKFFAQCSDVFAWGCADCEPILPSDIDALERAAADVRAVVDGEFHAGDLYGARRRGMRPQGAVYEVYPEGLWPLFNACGPEREVGLGNPRPIPTAKNGATDA